MKISIIELLNKSTENKLAPKRVLFDERVFYYDKDGKEYYFIDNDKEECISLLPYIYCEKELQLREGYESDYEILTQKVEIIEENNE